MCVMQVDMGFEPQVIEVLDAMGGLLKSEDEELAEQQLASGAEQYRVTAMVHLSSSLSLSSLSFFTNQSLFFAWCLFVVIVYICCCCITL